MLKGPGENTEHAPKGQQNNLQELTEIEASGGKYEISIKILTDSNSAAPRKYISSFVVDFHPFSVSACGC